MSEFKTKDNYITPMMNWGIFLMRPSLTQSRNYLSGVSDKVELTPHLLNIKMLEKLFFKEIMNTKKVRGKFPRPFKIFRDSYLMNIKG